MHVVLLVLLFKLIVGLEQKAEMNFAVEKSTQAINMDMQQIFIVQIQEVDLL